MRLPKDRAFILVVMSLLIFMFVPTVSVLGQQDTFERNFREWEMRRDALNRASELGQKPPVRRGPMAFALHRTESFRRLQILGGEIKEAAAKKDGELNFKLIAKSASEIKTFAKRLKQSLAIPNPEKDQRQPNSEIRAETEQLNSSLSALAELIDELSNNRVFKDTRKIDARVLAKAGSDLEAIIELSDHVKKRSQELARLARTNASRKTIREE